MDNNKYTVPSLPAVQLILEDLSDPEIIRPNRTLNICDDKAVQSAYICYQNFKQLKEDQEKQDELSLNLEELNKNLVKNIEKMKKHA